MDYGINFSYEDNKQLKEIYKELLKKNGLTMLEASKLLGLSTPQQLNNKFNNKKISLSDLKKFLSIMGYDYEITIKKRSGNV
jgi:transcriptional regulator with XRE-family HTH domain|nr:MAG TPA: helix-turn-helix domain protein [Caudoviricetes sp.]